MDRAVEINPTTIRVGRNAVARLSSQIAAKLLSLALLALVSRYEGSAGLGRYVLVTTVVSLVVAVSDLGLSMFLTREVARELAGELASRLAPEPSSSRRQTLLGDLLPLRMAAAALGAAVLICLAWGPIFVGETQRLFFFGAFSLLPKAATGTLSGFINGRQRMDVSSSIEVVARLLTLVGTVPALLSGFGIPGVLVCTAAADTIAILIYRAVLRSWHLLPRLRLVPAQWPDVVSRAYPFAVTGIIAMAYRRLDIVLLSAWQGDVAAGQYGAAYRLWETVGLIPASMMDAMFPEMARLVREHMGRARLRRILRRLGPLLMGAGLLLAALGALLAGTLLPLVYGRGQTLSGAVVAFRLQVWAIPAMFLYLLNGHALYALGRQRWVTVAMVIVGLLNVGLNLLVIPRWSVPGVSAVALFSAWLLWALLASLARRALQAAENES